MPLPRLLPNLLGLVALGFSLVSAAPALRAAEESISGLAGVGTWATRAEFKDIKVTKNGRTLFESDFSKGLDGWKTWRGQWEVVDGALRQTSLDEDARAAVGDATWSDYTLTFKARKLSGAEGFLALFGLPSVDADKSFWNIGGWGNTAHAVQSPGFPEERKNGRVILNRWHDIQVELSGNTVRTYLDGALVQTSSRPSDKDAQREFPHALIPDMLADPNIVEVDGTFYCYATTDGMGQHLSTSGLPVVWKSKDFLNWSFNGSIFPAGYDAKYWAPSVPVKQNGRYFLFPTLDNEITVVVSDSLDGPFRTLDGKDINKTSGWKPFPLGTGHPIDAEIFRDDDGEAYMLLSRRRIAKLKPDFSGLASPVTEIRTKRSGYSEGPAIFKREGVYYYLYTLGGSEAYQYAYMMSRKSPMGPWEAPAQDIISTTDKAQGIYGPGHGCFFNLQGSPRWFFVYLEYGRSSTNRQILAAEMRFNPDGTIQPIQLSKTGVGALRSDPAYPADKPNLALGGSNGSRWMAGANDSQAWYQIDLGKTRRLSRVELYFVKPTTGHAYRLESSTDGKKWKVVGGHEDLRIQSPHTDGKIGRARHLRVTILKGTPGLWEFRAY